MKNDSIIKLLIYIVIFGNIIKIPFITVMGMAVTIYRIFIPVLFIFSFYRNRRNDPFYFKGFINPTIFLFLFWIGYGFILLLTSKYVILVSGIKELLSLMYALMIIMIFYRYLEDENYESTIDTLQKSVGIMILIGLFELLTGYHLTTSKLISDIAVESTVVSVAKGTVMGASGIFFNVNDLCAFIAIFLPSLFFKFNEIPLRNKAIRLFLILAGFVIMLVNDANIAIISALVGLFIYIVVYSDKRNLLGLVLVFAPVIILVFAVLLEKILSVLNAQIVGMKSSAGSMFSRLTVYSDSINSFWDTFGLGVGPSGFTEYFKQNISNIDLTDPHNLWLEIFVKYGLLIFVLFVLWFYVLCRKLFIAYRNTNGEIFILCFAMSIVYIFAAIVPSTFLTNSYQWLLPAICIPALDSYKRERDLYEKIL